MVHPVRCSEVVSEESEETLQHRPFTPEYAYAESGAHHAGSYLLLFVCRLVFRNEKKILLSLADHYWCCIAADRLASQ